jgi:predicted Zn finger-like uncharacterized protein
MLIVCPNCATSYMIDPASIGPDGRLVRCARCRTTWFAGDAARADAPQFAATTGAQAPADADVLPAVSAEPVAAESHAETASDESPPTADWAAFETGAGAPDLVPELPPQPPSVTDAPSLVPPIGHPPLADNGHAGSEAEDIETFAARRKRLQGKRKQKTRSSRWTAVILVLFACNVALIGARSEVVRYLPQTASLFAAIGLPVNLRHLNFADVRIAKETENGATGLTIEGKIVSAGSRPVEVPRLRFAARNASGQEIYSWTAKPERSVLGPGESVDFRSHLAAPPADANDVMVRFLGAQDVVAGGK